MGEHRVNAWFKLDRLHRQKDLEAAERRREGWYSLNSCSAVVRYDTNSHQNLMKILKKERLTAMLESFIGVKSLIKGSTTYRQV